MAYTSSFFIAVGIGTWKDLKETISSLASPEMLLLAVFLPAFNVIPDFVSLGKARFATRLLGSATSTRARVMILLADFLASTLIAAVPAVLLITCLDYAASFGASSLREFLGVFAENWKENSQAAVLNLPSALFVSAWLWLYLAGSLILNTAHHFDVGYVWFNRHFDTKHMPLQCIGIVAATVVASVYLVGVLAARFLT